MPFDVSVSVAGVPDGIHTLSSLARLTDDVALAAELGLDVATWQEVTAWPTDDDTDEDDLPDPVPTMRLPLAHRGS